MIPSLQIEIYQQIINLSLPPFKPSEAQFRYENLLNYILVSQLWRELAEKELYKYVVIQDLKTFDLISKSFENDVALGKRTEVVCLEMPHYDVYNFDKLGLLFDRCSDVKELWIVGFETVHVLGGVFNFSSLLHLESLYLMDCTTEHDNPNHFSKLQHLPSNSFSSLQSLTIVHCGFPGDPDLLAQLLDHLLLPKVTKFTFVPIQDHASQENISSIQQIDSSFLNQLHTFILYDRYGRSEDTVVEMASHFTALQTLLLRDVYLLKQGFSLPPSLIEILILNTCDGLSNDIEYLLSAVIQSDASNLKYVRFPNLCDNDDKNVIALNEVLALRKIDLELCGLIDDDEQQDSFVQLAEMIEELAISQTSRLDIIRNSD